MGMKQAAILTVFLMTAFLLLLTAVGAEEKIIVAINDTPPWKMMVNGKPEGIDIAITDKLVSRLGMEPVYVMMPFKRCLRSLKNGKADLMGFLAYKKERTHFLKYLHPPYQGDVKIFYVRKGEAFRLKSYEDLHHLRVGLMRGHKHFDPFDNDTEIVKEEVDNQQSNYEKLILGRIDAVIENDTQGPYKTFQFGVSDKVEIAPYAVPLGKNGFFALSRQSPHLERLAEFETVLKQMVESGEIDAIIKSHMSNYAPRGIVQ